MVARNFYSSVKLIASALCAALALSASAMATSLVTDTSMYPPGDTVKITGSVYGANESVRLNVTHKDGTPVTGTLPWTTVTNASGQFTTTYTTPYLNPLPETLLVAATGLSSGLLASTSFLTAIGIDLDQLQNGTTSAAPEWANGDINKTNSCYTEANSVPFRYFVEGTTGGSKHVYTISMEWTKGGIHGYDYITDYDLSEAGPILTAGGPCGSPNTPPGDCASPSGSFALPSPLVVANYTGSIPTDFFTTINPGFVLDGSRNLRFYNATIDSIGKYYFGGTPSDRTFSFAVYFTTSVTGSVGFYWGGHLASGTPTAWGAGLGSASVAGAPLHMRTTDFDNGGGANQDKSIQNGSLCLPPTVSISCAVADTVCFDGTYTCSVAAGAGTYNWTVTGATITSGQGTNSLTYHVTASAGGSVTLSAEGCNSSTSCVGDFCCATASVTIPVKNCNTCPTVACHADTSVFLCSSQQVCIPGFSWSDPDNNIVSITATGGTLSGNSICFTPATSGVYPLRLIVVDSYGCADTCTTNVTVTLNSAPVGTNPPASVDTVMCAAGQICRQFSATDPNGGVLTWTKLTGAGTMSASGLWCFTPTGAGSYCVTATVSDPCGAKDTVSMCYNVTLNTPPVATNPPASVDTVLCAAGQICRQFSATDANGNGLVWALLSGSGTVSPSGLWCFTASATGSYCVSATVADPCGAKDTVSMCYNVTLNSPPVASNPPATVDTFMCASAAVCRQFSATDANGNGLVWLQLSGSGTVSLSGLWCFTPNASGSYCVTATVTDPCGAKDTVSMCYNVTLNSPPSVSLGTDSSVFQCTGSQICRTYTITDPNNNVTLEQLVSGSGTIDTAANKICFTPVSSGAYTFIVKVTDACGATAQDTVVFNVTINSAPQVSFGPDKNLFLCTSQTLCEVYSVSDPNGLSDIASETVVTAPPGTSFDTSINRLCYTPTTAGTYTFIVKVTDKCGASDQDTIVLTVAINRPPTVAFTTDTVKTFICLGTDSAVCVGYSVSDLDGGKLTETLVSGTAVIDTTLNTVCVAPNANGTYVVVVQVTDSCGASSRDTAVIQVRRELCCPSIAIEKKHKAIQGTQSCVSITMQGRAMAMGGFDLLVAYDASAMTPMSVNQGQLISDCKWEYFTYRYGSSGNCGSACPSGLIRIISVAETDNGAYHPLCFGPNSVDTVQLATICFLVSNDRTLECQFAPIRFFWIDCGDNVVSSKYGDTTFVSDTIYDYDNAIPINDGTVGFPTVYGAQNSCIGVPLPGKPPQQRCLDFQNGGIDIICADSIDARGDVNLNGSPYEIADAVMFSNYFIQGLSAFAPHPTGSIAATDANADGLSLSVADLVYMIRVIVGDARKFPKPTSLTAELSTDHGSIRVTGVELGAIFMVLKGNVTPVLATADAKMEYGFDGANTRVLVHVPFDIEAHGSTIQGFTGDIIYSDAELVSVEMADKQGFAIDQAMPTEYSLLQNYPNPFNPTTNLSFDLPVASNVTLDVFDLLGRHVATLVSESMPAGRHSVEWNGRDSRGQMVASGVYLYRLDTGSYHATRKMVLLK